MKLIKYLRERIKDIRFLKDTIETHFEEKYRSERSKTKNGESIPCDIAKNLHDYDFVLPNTFRYCVLIAVCSFVEESLTLITSEKVDNYKSEYQKIKNIGIFEKNVKLLTEKADIKFDKIKEDINWFKDIIVVRNVIVHAWGKIKNYKSPERVEKIIEDNKDEMEETQDGYIFLTDSVIPTAINRAENIIRHIIDYNYGK